MPRLFVALDLPEPVKERLETLCHGVPGARWMQDGQFHLTLAFLGDVDGPVFEDVQQGLNGVRADPFELTLAGLGHFPPRGAPRVLWAGVAGDAGDHELHELVRQVRRCLARRGVDVEKRKYAPHVTLARLRDAPLPPILRFLKEHEPWSCEPFAVTDFQLFSSVLGRSGAKHRIEASYPLIPGRAS